MDLSLQPARPHNQTLVLSNHLVIITVEFLNKFAEECDAKLCKLHQKMQRLEVEVKLLEFKLSSIPGRHGTSHAPLAPGLACSRLTLPSGTQASTTACLRPLLKLLPPLEHRPSRLRPQMEGPQLRRRSPPPLRRRRRSPATLRHHRRHR